MQSKKNVMVLCGGRSAEHEISLLSANNIIREIQKSLKDEFEVLVVGISRKGEWFLQNPNQAFENTSDPKSISLAASDKKISFHPGDDAAPFKCEGKALSVDLVFPIVHGTFGEDGTLQGLLKMLDVPFVGADVLGTAVGMDKEVMKRLFTQAQIPNAKFKTLYASEKQAALKSYEVIKSELGQVVFVKPANTGSSVGVHKVKTFEDWHHAIEDAFLYDNKIIVEEFIEGREIECSVLGNDPFEASLVGEIISHHEFYSYEAKYLDPNGADTQIPADVTKDSLALLQDLAKKTMRVLNCEGMARVDFFLKKDGAAYVNEVNTLPGFTNISMYPKLWEASGLKQAELLRRLINLALQRHDQQKQIKFV